jgi:hypothetical protein
MTAAIVTFANPSALRIRAAAARIAEVSWVGRGMR